MHALISPPPPLLFHKTHLANFSGLAAISIPALVWFKYPSFILLFCKKKILISRYTPKNRTQKNLQSGQMLFLSASACQEVRGSWLCCSPHQSRILSFSFTHSITENTKLHRHISLGKDIFTLMHKQALTQHPRGEKARIMFRDVAVPKALC